MIKLKGQRKLVIAITLYLYLVSIPITGALFWSIWETENTFKPEKVYDGVVVLTGGVDYNWYIGEKVYKANCAICHGQELQGDIEGTFPHTTGTYPSLKNLDKKLSRKETIAVIDKGKGFMPSFNQFSYKKKNALLSFLYNENLSTNNESDGNQSWLENLRKELFDFKIPYTHTGYN